MERKIGILLILIAILSACEDTNNRGYRVRVQITETPIAAIPSIPTPSVTITPQTRDVKVKVAVDSAADLRVVAGTNVKAGQTIAERYSAKQKLANERQLLTAKLQEIQQSDRTALTAPQIEQAKFDLQAAELDLKEFSATRRWTSTAYEQFPDLTEAEAKKGRALEERYRQAQNRLKQLDADFKATLVREKQQKNLIVKQITAIDAQIDKVGVARSPYSGTIKDIKLIELPGKETTAEITIAVPNKPVEIKKTPLSNV